MFYTLTKEEYEALAPARAKLEAEIAAKYRAELNVQLGTFGRALHKAIKDFIPGDMLGDPWGGRSSILDNVLLKAVKKAINECDIKLPRRK